MKKELIERIFSVLSVMVGFITAIIVFPYVNEIFSQKGYSYLMEKILTMSSFILVVAIAGIIFYLLFISTMRIIEKIKSKKK